MSITTKKWKLPSRYDDSDPDAKILEEDLLKTFGIKKPTLYAQLPANKFPREDGYIMGIKLRLEETESIPPPPPDDAPVVAISCEELNETELIKSSEPLESLHQLKEVGRLANNRIAEMYKTIDHSRAKVHKKEGFPEWFKSAIWRKANGQLDKVACPVCSLNLISVDSFSAGHILPESKGGMMCIENIIPICPECNSQMATRHLYWFAWHYYGKVMWSVY